MDADGKLNEYKLEYEGMNIGLPAYIVNFDELIKGIAIDGVTVEIDTSEIEYTLAEYFPEVIRLLKQTRDKTEENQGIQKVKGLISTGETVSFIPSVNIAITGVAFSQNIFDGSVLDRWNMKVASGGNSISILDDIYSKDSLQHKYFESFYAVPAGYEIIIEPTSQTSGKTFWFDIEYLELN